MRTWILAIATALLLAPAAATAGNAKLTVCLARCETNCKARCDVHKMPRTAANRDCRAKCDKREKRCIDRCNYKYRQR